MDLCERSDSIYRHPWELSRTDVLLGELDKLKVSGDVLDIGCGDGYFEKQMLKRFPSVTDAWGIDIHAKNCIHAGRWHSVNSYKEIEGKKFDYILMMDVLEHIGDDVGFLKDIRKYQKPGTVIFITVPAFQFLFSLHDEELHHYRRYNYAGLKGVLEQAGYKVAEGGWSYFYFSLILMRLVTRNKTQNLGMWNRGETNWVTVLIRKCLNIDYAVLRFLSRFRIHIGGLSLMVICK